MQGLHLMLSNTQCQPDGGFHWFAVAARYTSASEAPIAAGGAAEGGGAAQKAGDAGPGSGVPLLRTLQPGVRRTMPWAASTTASGVVAASRAAATHGLGGGADPARVRSNRQLQNARKRAKQLE